MVYRGTKKRIRPCSRQWLFHSYLVSCSAMSDMVHSYWWSAFSLSFLLTSSKIHLLWLKYCKWSTSCCSWVFSALSVAWFTMISYQFLWICGAVLVTILEKARSCLQNAFTQLALTQFGILVSKSCNLWTQLRWKSQLFWEFSTWWLDWCKKE